jgi:integrase
MSEREIIRQKGRILTPREYQAFRSCLNPTYQVISDVLFHTGLRIVEFWAFVEHPEWYHASVRVIDLPEEGSTKKKKAEYVQRTIRLTLEGCKAVELLNGLHPRKMTRVAMGDAFKRAAIKANLGTKGITPKCLRKSLVSLLMEVRKDLNIDSLDIGASMGHDLETLRVHYLGVGFSKEDHDDIVEFLKGWKTT